MVNKIKIHDIRIYIIIHGLLLFLIRPYLTYVIGPNVVTGPGIDQYVYSIALQIGLFAFFSMLFIVWKTNTKGQDDNFIAKVSSVSVFRFFLTFFIWVVLYIAFNYQRLSVGIMTLILEPQYEFLQSDSSFISNNLTGIYSFFLIAVFSVKTSKKIKKALIIFVLLGALPVGLISGSKTLVLNPLFLLLLRYSAEKKGVSSFLIAILLIIGIPIFSALEYVRYEGFAGFSNFFSGSKFDLNHILLVATNRFYGTDIVYSIINHHESLNFPYLLGSSFLGIIFFLVPRSLWKDKPVISFGKTVSEDYLGSDFWSTGISAAPTWIGELFANFGYFSLPLYLVSLFLIMKYISSYFSAKKSVWKRVYFYPLAFTTLSFFQEASIAGWILQLVTLLALCYFFSILLHGRQLSIKKLQ